MTVRGGHQIQDPLGRARTLERLLSDASLTAAQRLSEWQRLHGGSPNAYRVARKRYVARRRAAPGEPLETLFGPPAPRYPEAVLDDLPGVVQGRCFRCGRWWPRRDDYWPRLDGYLARHCRDCYNTYFRSYKAARRRRGSTASIAEGPTEASLTAGRR